MGEGKTLIGVCLSIIISLCYCYYVSSRIPKGKLRFISVLPIFYLFAILPLYLSSALTTVITFFFITWLANFKLLLFCFGCGPIPSGPPTSLLIFITIAALPYEIKENIDHSVDRTQPKKEENKNSKPKKSIPLNLPAKILIIALSIPLLHDNRQGNYIHPILVFVLYFFLLYLFIDVIVACANSVVRAVVGVEHSSSDEPYLSNSLQDFWGRRWNLMATNILRHTVYLPLKSASTGYIGKDMASMVAVFGTFVVSGLMHEVMLYQLVRKPTTWEMGSFFVLHGVCVAVELIVKRAFADRNWQLLPVVSGLLKVGFVGITGFWLMLPPVINSGLDVKVIDEGMFVIESMKNKLQEMYFSVQTWICETYSL